MDKSNKKISNIVRCFFFFGTFAGAVTAVQANPEEESEISAENESPINRRERAVQRAKKIVNLALFDAINQGSLQGVRFLVESGADPMGENSHGRTPLDLAEYLARKNSEEEECLEIVDFLRNWTPEKYPVDDAVTVATAREVSGLNGGGKAGLAKKAIKLAKKAVKASDKAQKKGTSSAIYAANKAAAKANDAAARAASVNSKGVGVAVGITTGTTKGIINLSVNDAVETCVDSVVSASVASTVGGAIGGIPGAIVGAAIGTIAGDLAVKAVKKGVETFKEKEK